MKAVHIQCLNDKKQPVKGAYASGFIIQESKKFYLYTCWHVVTGYNMHDVKIGRVIPNRKYLEVNLQACKTLQPGLQSIGGNQSTILPLYDSEDKPLWIQNKQDVAQPDLNSIGLKVPFWHDAIKLELPQNISLSDLQYIKENEVWKSLAMVGEKLYIVGYPYGYSALGTEQPTAIILTRFIAAERIKDRQTEILLDGPGAPGMSGGPVFIEHDAVLYLLGIYTGLIYPDHVIEKNEKTTALGTMSNMVLWWTVENE